MKPACVWAGCTLLLALAFAPVQASGGTESAGTVVRYTTAKSFADVIFDLNFAITDRNFRITGRNTIGAGLRDRGYTDFPDVEVVHFCSLERAREVLLIDPGFVAQMPCRITVHAHDGATIISVIMLPLDHPDARVNAFSRRLNAMLTDIAEFIVTPAGQ
ncbi:MAG: DUF302 domain-containing protein [Gammaproteobacteria bacterium]